MNRRKRCLERKIKKAKTDAVWLELSHYKKGYKKALDKTRKEFYSSKIERFNRNVSKSLFKTFNLSRI